MFLKLSNYTECQSPLSLIEIPGTQLHFNIALHPQIDGQFERVIQILEDMLRCCILEFECNWEKYLPSVEFAYNNSYQSSIKMASHEALYSQLSEKKIYGVDLIRETEEKIGDKVFLKVSPWKKVLQFGRKGKLSPQFIGPYEVIERIGPVAYRLALPPELYKIHNVFHSDPSHVISSTEVEIQLDMTYSEEPIKILAHETKELRNKKVALVKVFGSDMG
ncbi:DNA/RNA polymerases superfamily protein [Gossypium australe]|uniref:DNA/RNA polymerases superfamily protein n=1 Tax=Gossypium australe TaxID=47621 RepID=A0A5B6VK33_9ROSI|nr:DNA/RNA polymerases superfamily protein [Gossypium australe]